MEPTNFFCPADGIAADFIPFYHAGAFHLFYLKDYRDPAAHGEGTPWFHIATTDFIHFEDWGEALPRGKGDAQDLYVFTGSVIANQAGPKQGFYIFYTGHNPHFEAQGKPIQTVLRAWSPDLRTWSKDADFIFKAPLEQGYEANDWRDPFVFWNAAAGEYWMLLAARKNQGPSRHRGLTALASSTDLEHWQVRQPFWAPDAYFTHECPDLFQIGEWWYLVYSTFSERCVTHYRMSRSLSGPWLTPPNDTFDGRAFYAAKTAAGKDGKRFIFGWLPTRSGAKDDGDWNWGGNLVVHEIVQNADGSLGVRLPQSIETSFSQQSPFALLRLPLLGEWQQSGETHHCDATGRFSALLLASASGNPLLGSSLPGIHLIAGEPAECLVQAEVTLFSNAASGGILLRASDNLERYYQVRLEPANQRLVIDRWPRPGDQPWMLERPLEIHAGMPTRLKLLINRSCLVIYANDTLALSCRLYDHPSGKIGLFAADGKARFQLKIKNR